VSNIEYKWDETLRTGDALADEQHKELIRQMNLLMQALSRGEGEYQVNSLLQFLSGYVIEHFKHEEACMDKYRCPAAVENKLAHAEFLKKFAAFRQQLAGQSANAMLVSIQMMRELSTWLINHIRRVDAQLRPCVKS